MEWTVCGMAVVECFLVRAFVKHTTYRDLYKCFAYTFFSVYRDVFVDRKCVYMCVCLYFCVYLYISVRVCALAPCTDVRYLFCHVLPGYVPRPSQWDQQQQQCDGHCWRRWAVPIPGEPCFLLIFTPTYLCRVTSYRVVKKNTCFLLLVAEVTIGLYLLLSK